MENNFSDKGLREKLRSVEAPFDPKAWEQMEQMLDRKKKRRFIFWWWTAGGIAAFILLGVAGYEWKAEVGNQKLEVRNENAGPVGENEMVNNKNEKKQSQANTAANVNDKENSERSQKKRLNTKLPRQNKNKAQQSASLAQSVVGKKATHQYKYALSNKPDALTSKQAKALAEFKQEAQLQDKAIVSAIVLEAMKPDKLLSPVELEEMVLETQKEERAEVKKMKKRFTYSVGVMAQITATTLGAQSYALSNPMSVARPRRIYSQPSYMVGFTQDFMIGKRVSFINAWLFSQTSFKVYNPKTVSFSQKPVEYSSKISEVNITIGVIGYPVSKEKFRFHLAAGIINHIKLKETFNYKKPVPTTTTSNPAMDSIPVFPAATNFSENYSADVTNAPQSSSGNTSDFSINKAARYYTSFYASAGVDFIFKRRFVVFAEPLYFMSLQKIGVQDKRKHNFGLSAGARFQF